MTTSAGSTRPRRRRGSPPPTCSAALYTPHCARVHPARLVRGLAAVVERKGATIYEQSRVVDLAPGTVGTAGGRVRAERVVLATEGYGAQLPGRGRTVAPIYSLMIATEPLPARVWDEIGWAGRETLADGRHLIIYAQRTADDRIAFGGRGAPYHFGSRIHDDFDRDRTVFADLRSVLIELFPSVAGRTHHARMGRSARRPARLVLVGRLRPRDGRRLGRWVRG